MQIPELVQSSFFHAPYSDVSELEAQIFNETAGSYVLNGTPTTLFNCITNPAVTRIFALHEHGKLPENLHISKYCIYVYFISTNGRNADNFGMETWSLFDIYVYIWEWHIIPNFYEWDNLIRGGGSFSYVISNVCMHYSYFYKEPHLLKLGNLAFTFTVLGHV